MVADSGFGIVLADCPHCFDRFLWADKIRSREIGDKAWRLNRQVECEHENAMSHSAVDHGWKFDVRLPSSEREATSKA
jgi:signal transduction histidine kinase